MENSFSNDNTNPKYEQQVKTIEEQAAKSKSMTTDIPRFHFLIGNINRDSIPLGQTKVFDIYAQARDYDEIVDYVFTANTLTPHIFAVVPVDKQHWEVHVFNNSGGPVEVAVAPVYVRHQV
ncbi:hypothetical protein V7088_10595 [Priestia megaterium]|uniref:hypothetical protein n=1 Tax=Priestia megaterium TaxID=1404 RepID=UPI002FFDE413